MEKRKVTVFVAGQKLNLITTDTDKYVADIASKVDTAVNSLLNCTNMSREKCAVMAALDFCDDEAKARVALNEIKEQIKDYIKDTASLREEIDKLNSEIDRLKGEKEELLKTKKTLVASAVEIKKSTEKNEKTETEINADDDLSFDFDEDEEAVKNQGNEKKADKKRHAHEHKNPYKERFMKQQDDKAGYTPLRQYSLFDNED